MFHFGGTTKLFSKANHSLDLSCPHDLPSLDEHKSLSLHPTPKRLKMEEEPCVALSLVPSTSARPQTLPGAPFMSAGSAPSSLPADTPFPFRPASYFTGKRLLGVEEWKEENGCFITVHLQPPLIVLQPCNFVLLREEACTQGAWALDGGEGNNNSSSSSKCAFTSPYTPGATQVLYTLCSSHSNLMKEVLALPLSLRVWKYRQLTSLTSSPSVCPPPPPSSHKLLWAPSTSPPLLLCSYLRLSHHRRSPFTAKPLKRSVRLKSTSPPSIR